VLEGARDGLRRRRAESYDCVANRLLRELLCAARRLSLPSPPRHAPAALKAAEVVGARRPPSQPVCPPHARSRRPSHPSPPSLPTPLLTTSCKRNVVLGVAASGSRAREVKYVRVACAREEVEGGARVQRESERR